MNNKKTVEKTMNFLDIYSDDGAGEYTGFSININGLGGYGSAEVCVDPVTNHEGFRVESIFGNFFSKGLDQSDVKNELIERATMMLNAFMKRPPDILMEK